MKHTDIEHVRQKLETQRQEALHFLSRIEDETRSLDADSTLDTADRCVISMSKESLFERSSQRRTFLRLIDAALRRIADGSFGVCAGCGEDIQERRLQAVPWTHFCLRCQEELEEEVGATVSARTATENGGMGRRAG